jgi:hypothetical protein
MPSCEKLPGAREVAMRYIAELAKEVERDPELARRIKEDPAKALQELARPEPLKSDVWIYRMVVGVLGLIGLVAVLGAILLTAMGKGGDQIPGVVTALGSAAIGALAGLLAPSPRE